MTLITHLATKPGFNSGHIDNDSVIVQWYVSRCGKILEVSTPVDSYKEVLDNILMAVENTDCEEEFASYTFGMETRWLVNEPTQLP